MNYLDYSEIRAINLEHTNRCNCLCTQCARTLNGRQNPNIQPMRDVSMEDVRRILPESFLKQIKHIFFIGNYGDVVAAKNVNELIEYLNQNNVITTLKTNGSLRNKEWWKHFGKTLKGKVVFSIDGLGDINKIYRVNSNYKKIMKNVEAFLNAGGKARWDFIVFEHNKHQVKDAKKLASKMGFDTFNLKQTARFVDNRHYKKNLNKKENVKQNSKFGSVVERYGSWGNYINQTHITCNYQQDGIIYIDFDLNLWPCCWLGAPLFFYGDDNIQKNQILKLYERYGEGFNSLKDKTIDEVLEHPWFNHDLADSWTNTMQDENFKMMTCGRTCGTEYKFSSSDESNKEEIKL